MNRILINFPSIHRETGFDKNAESHFANIVMLCNSIYIICNRWKQRNNPKVAATFLIGMGGARNFPTGG